jgi:hypothetical protein
MYCAAMAAGFGDQDFAAIFRIVGGLAGLNGGRLGPRVGCEIRRPA